MQQVHFRHPALITHNKTFTNVKHISLPGPQNSTFFLPGNLFQHTDDEMYQTVQKKQHIQHQKGRSPPFSSPVIDSTAVGTKEFMNKNPLKVKPSHKCSDTHSNLQHPPRTGCLNKAYMLHRVLMDQYFILLFYISCSKIKGNIIKS